MRGKKRARNYGLKSELLVRNDLSVHKLLKAELSHQHATKTEEDIEYVFRFLYKSYFRKFATSNHCQ